jgi:hypothetical protein
MSDNLPPEPTPPAEAGLPTTVISISGGVYLDAQHDVNIGGDVVGRDKIIQTVTNFFGFDTEQQRALRNRRNMLELVKNTWVEGVLKKSLYHEVMLDLGLEARPDEVQRPWDMTLQMSDRENRQLPRGVQIIQVFDDLNHNLLILGESGSGKTTLLLELARDTTTRAEQDLTQPIPVVFNLSSWSDPKQPFEDWLVEELREKYDADWKDAKRWIKNNDLLLLLDGLDEVKADHREACAKAINDFRGKHGQTQLVVCCRVEDYRALNARLKLRGAVLIQPLSPQQIDEYLASISSDLAAAHQALRHDADLMELMQSPLMLGIIILAYREMPIDMVADKQADSSDGWRKHLFDAYTQQMFNRIARTKNELYPRRQTTHWLGWLAQRLIQHSQTIFLLYQLPISWLPAHQRRLYRLFFGLALGSALSLVLAIAAALVFGLGVGPAAGLVGMLTNALVLALILVPVLGSYIAGSEWQITGLKLSWKGGLRSTEITVGTTYTQVIRQSIRHAVGIGLITGLFLGLGLLPAVGLVGGLVGGFALGLFFGLSKGGGMAVVHHVTLLFIFRRNGDIPPDYLRFLDYAADRIFLRKVGGGYIFIHRMLMEYFAVLETEPNVGDGK